MVASPELVIEVKNLCNQLGGMWVHDGLDIDIKRGEIVAIVGGSGAGKTTLLRTLLMLLRPASGEVRVFDTDVLHCGAAAAEAVRRRWGVLFQQNALFSSLTVLENVMFQLKEFTSLSKNLRHQVALLKIALVGLPLDAASKYPAELSGGMRKRAAAARAMALDPELLFLDEPTSGLDPKSAYGIDQLVMHLRDTLGVTIVMITHDVNTLQRAADRVAFIGEGKVLAYAPLKTLVKSSHPLIQDYFANVTNLDKRCVPKNQA